MRRLPDAAPAIDAEEVQQDLRAELLRRAERDQAARRTDDAETISQVDAENLPWLTDLIARIGWPGRSVAGADGAGAAWLLVQHADSDPGFQRRCLDLLTAAAAQGEASSTHVAYLTDHVLVAEGKPQEYGTQITGRKGRWEPLPLRDPGSVDERRADVSLGPLADYAAGFAADGPPEPPVVSCPTCQHAVPIWLPDPGEEAVADRPGCGRTLRIGAWRRQASGD